MDTELSLRDHVFPRKSPLLGLHDSRYNIPMTREVRLSDEVARCTHCGQWLPLDAFGRRSKDPFGFSPRCKECVANIHRMYKDRREARLQGLLTLADTETPAGTPYVPERWGPPVAFEELTDEQLAALNRPPE